MLNYQCFFGCTISREISSHTNVFLLSAVDTTNCEDNSGILVNDICYVLSTEKATWEEARYKCETDYDGSLAVILKKVVYDSITDNMQYDAQ